jgi:ribosome-associated protein
MLTVNRQISIADDEIEIAAIRAQGSGGQNVNKVSSAIHLRFDINASSLPEIYKRRLLALHDRRISKQGVIIIKAQQYRTQEQNRDDALKRLADLLGSVTRTAKPRRPTKPSRRSQQKRLNNKTRRGQIKRQRQRVDPE